MAQSIQSFVRSTRLLERGVRAVVALATHALVLGFVLLVVGFVWPAWSRTGLYLAGIWLALLFAYRLVRRSRPILETDRVLGLKDRLATWWSTRGARTPMHAWLEADLDAQLVALPDERRGALWRRQARRLWWLVPILLIVWTIGPLGQALMMTSETGTTEVAKRGPGAASRPGEGAGARAKSDGDRSEGPPRPDDAQLRRDQPEKAPVRPEGQAEERDPDPIPELPSQEEFVIPRVIGAGTGKRQRMKVAVIEQGDPAAAPRKVAATRKAATEAERKLEFEAAAERAIRSRHVPRSERPFVKRYFQELLEGRR